MLLIHVVSAGAGMSMKASSFTCLEPQFGGLEWPEDDCNCSTGVIHLRPQFSLLLASSVLYCEISGPLPLHVAFPHSHSSTVDRLLT